MPDGSRARRLGVVLLTGSVLPLLAPAAPAGADVGPVRLYVRDVTDLAVDESHGRIMLAAGRLGPGVVVTDLSGAQLTTLGLPGTTGLAPTADRRSVWAARRGELARIDTASLQVVQRIALPVDHCADDVAVVGTRLVYSSACRVHGDGLAMAGFGVVEAATGRPLGSTTIGHQEPPAVAAGRAGQVYVADTGLSPAGLYLYDVRGPAPRLLATHRGECGNLRDLSARPDGEQVVTACGAPYRHEVYSAKGLAPAGSYPSSSYPIAGAWSADGAAFAAGSDSVDDTDVRVYPAGGSVPTQTLDLPPDEQLLPRGLAVSADGRRIWAVTATRVPSGNVLALRSLEADGPAASSLTLDGSLSPEFYAGGVASSGGTLSHGGVGIAGVPVTITRWGNGGGAPVALPPVTTSGDGSFSFTDTPSIGTWSYTAAWAGDDTRPAVSATGEVVVRPVLTSVQLALAVSKAGLVTGTVQLTSDEPGLLAGRYIDLYRVRSDGAATSLPALFTDSTGAASFSDSPGAGTHTYVATLHTDVLLESQAQATTTLTGPKRTR